MLTKCPLREWKADKEEKVNTLEQYLQGPKVIHVVIGGPLLVGKCQIDVRQTPGRSMWLNSQGRK